MDKKAKIGDGGFGVVSPLLRKILHRPELSRVLDSKPDLLAKPVTLEEELFVGFLMNEAKWTKLWLTPDGVTATPCAFCAKPGGCWPPMATGATRLPILWSPQAQARRRGR